jgi:hypothetical protein
MLAEGAAVDTKRKDIEAPAERATMSQPAVAEQHRDEKGVEASEESVVAKKTPAVEGVRATQEHNTKPQSATGAQNTDKQDASASSSSQESTVASKATPASTSTKKQNADAPKPWKTKSKKNIGDDPDGAQDIVDKPPSRRASPSPSEGNYTHLDLSDF